VTARLGRFDPDIESARELLFVKPFAPGIVKIKEVMIGRPDSPQTDAARSTQLELKSAEGSAANERRHFQRKLFGNKVFVPTESFMDVPSQGVHGLDVSSGFWHQVPRNSGMKTQ
jgi:hypothetical protein